MAIDLRGFKAKEAVWTALVVDPIAAALLPVLLRVGATANALTFVSLLIGLCSGPALLWVGPWAALVIYQVAFLFDCLDGKVARIRGGSKLGPAFDIVADRARVASMVIGSVVLFDDLIFTVLLVAALAVYNIHTLQYDALLLGGAIEPARFEQATTLHPLRRMHRSMFVIDWEMATFCFLPVAMAILAGSAGPYYLGLIILTGLLATKVGIKFARLYVGPTDGVN